jgi:hypothetical protein
LGDPRVVVTIAAMHESARVRTPGLFDFYVNYVICSPEHMSLKRKMRKRPLSRIRNAAGREVILAPIIGKDGKIHRFIVIPRLESNTYLRVD